MEEILDKRLLDDPKIADFCKRSTADDTIIGFDHDDLNMIALGGSELRLFSARASDISKAIEDIRKNLDTANLKRYAVLLTIPTDMLLAELNTAMDKVTRMMQTNADIIFGAVYSPENDDDFKIEILAAY